jgi:glycosyltransferase involved in cell wall biosynthesis
VSTVNTKTPKVSVIVTVYNGEQYLGKCLDGIVGQTLRDIEIILVNDGSTDGSLEILKRYAGQDDRIIIVDKPNAGLGHTFNTGLDYATGKYIGYVETDDWIETDMFEKLYSLAEEHNAEVVRSFPYAYSGKTGISVPTNHLPHSATEKVVRIQDHVDYANNLPPEIWACLYLRKFLLNHNIRMNETPGAQFQDMGFSLEVLASCERMYITDGHYYHYQTDNAMSSLGKDRNGGQWEINEWEFFKEWLRNVFPGEDRVTAFQGVAFRVYRSALSGLLGDIGTDRKREIINEMHRYFRGLKADGKLDRRCFSDDTWRYLNLLLRSKSLFKLSLKLYPLLIRIAGRRSENER